MREPITYDKRLFAENLRSLMERNREKQADIARMLGVSKSTVSSYCAALQMPRMDKLEQLAHHYGVSRSALLGEEGELSARAEALLRALNPAGQQELLRYGRYLAQQAEFRAEGED